MFKKLALAGLFGLALVSVANAQSPTTPTSGALTCNGSLQQLPVGALSNGLVIKADKSNVGTIYIGGPNTTTSGATQGYPLIAGEAISYGTTSISLVYAYCSTSGDVLHFTGN